MKFVLIGAGQRGMIYARYAFEKGHAIAAVAETDPVKREIAAAEFGIPAEVRTEIVSWCNVVCIMLILPAGLAFLYMRHKTMKSKKLKAESVTEVEQA